MTADEKDLARSFNDSCDAALLNFAMRLDQDCKDWIFSNFGPKELTEAERKKEYRTREGKNLRQKDLERKISELTSTALGRDSERLKELVALKKSLEHRWYLDNADFSAVMRVIGDVQRYGSPEYKGQDLAENRQRFLKTNAEKILQLRAIVRAYSFLAPAAKLFERWIEAEDILQKVMESEGLSSMTPGSVFFLLGPSPRQKNYQTMKIPISEFIRIMDYGPLYSRYAQIGVFEEEVLSCLTKPIEGVNLNPWDHFIDVILNVTGLVPLAFWLSAETQNVDKIIPHNFRPRGANIDSSKKKRISTRYSKLATHSIENISNFSQHYATRWFIEGHHKCFSGTPTPESWKASGLSHFVFSAIVASQANRYLVTNDRVRAALTMCDDERIKEMLDSRSSFTVKNSLRANEFYMSEDGRPFDTKEPLSQFAAALIKPEELIRPIPFGSGNLRYPYPRPAVEPLLWVCERVPKPTPQDDKSARALNKSKRRSLQTMRRISNQSIQSFPMPFVI